MAFKVIGLLGCDSGSLVLVFLLLRLLVWAVPGRSGWVVNRLVLASTAVGEKGLLGMAELLVGVRVLREIGRHHRVEIRSRIGAREGELVAWYHWHYWVRLLEAPVIGHNSRRMLLLHINSHRVLLK